ncbi:MAG: ABC transporter permease [Erysipelotrichaceae bacterium]
MRKLQHRIFFLAGLFIIWQLAYVQIDNTIIVPSIGMVVETMVLQLFDVGFYQAILATLTRSLSGLALGVVVALVASVSMLTVPVLRHYISLLVAILKSIPNISYIIIVLIWLGSESSVMVIIFLVLFPIFFYNMQAGFSSIDKTLLDVLRIYPVSKWEAITKVYLPLSISHIKAALASGFGLAFKVGVMAEILGQVQVGIGKQLYLGRVYLEMDQIFAWTIWIIALLFVGERLLAQVYKIIEFGE